MRAFDATHSPLSISFADRQTPLQLTVTVTATHMVQAGNAAGYSASVVSSNQDAETYNSHEQWDPLIGRTLSSISEGTPHALVSINDQCSHFSAEPVFPLVQRVKSEVTEGERGRSGVSSRRRQLTPGPQLSTPHSHISNCIPLPSTFPLFGP